jgi:hypothetical protein
MISAFQSRELGFGIELTKERLDEVNFLRRGKKFIDEEAAKKYKGHAQKTDLLCSPFFLNLITGHQMKVTGTMTRWCCSLKIAWMF